MIKKILIANRGEIAIRIMEACKELSITSVAIFADNDRDSFHVKYADEAYNLGSGQLKDTYMNIDKIVDIAIKTGAEAIHPAYGFLSEKSEFAKACEDKGVIFIGPSSNVINSMGDKIRARGFMTEAGLPITPGTIGGVKTPEEIIDFANKHGYPVALKATAGGGGRGIKPIYSPDNVKELLESAMREGKNYFGDDTVYVEKFLDNPRHIEVQILADNYGNVIHLGERNCSVQRRNQKLIEETPSPYLSDELRKQITESAIKGAKFLGYRNAGTFEFLEQDGNFYFMEVNTRLQVEHPITEMVNGIDIVKEQISIASGNKLNYKQEDVQPRGHAIEYRITVEDVKNNFRPTSGHIEDYSEPSGFGVRVDAVAKKGWTIPSEYDSLIAKLIVWDETRDRAIEKSKRALSEYLIKGIPTTIDFHRWAIDQDDFKNGDYSTKFISKNFKSEFLPELDLLSDKQKEVKEKELIEIEVNGKLFNVILYKEDKKQSKKTEFKKSQSVDTNANKGEIKSQMAGTVVKVSVEKGQKIQKGDVLLVLEAMKMESDINSPCEGTIKDILVSKGESIASNQVMVIIE